MRLSLFYGILSSPLLACLSLGADMPGSNVLWSDTPSSVVPAENKKIKDGSFGSYSAPVSVWESEGFPIGNGRIGAMILSAPQKERFALNENSLWSGGINSKGDFAFGPDSKDNEFGSYQPFGDLFVDWNIKGEPRQFTRSLDLKSGIHKVSFQDGAGTTYSRNAFASAPNQVIVIRYRADAPGSINADFSFASQHKAQISSSGKTMTMKGTLANGLKYEGQLRLVTEGGSVTNNDNGLQVKGASSCTVYLAMGTSYLMNAAKQWKGADPRQKNDSYLNRAIKDGYQAVASRHLQNYKSLFGRVELDLGKSPSAKTALPTSKRLADYKNSQTDPELEATMFQYGRYLLISCSRPGSLPANLQGLWNDNVRPPWACDYHSNINFQMAYWAAESTNLSECHQPMIDFIDAISSSCAQATRASFKKANGGDVRGWTVRISQNPFGANGCNWNIPGSAWYVLHAWEHYMFNQDKAYLKKQAYPMMKEVCHFWEDHLKELGEGGKGFKSQGKELVNHPDLKNIKAGTLVAPDGWSPEHGPRHEDGIMHDQQIIRELFTNTIAAAKILREDAAWAQSLQGKLNRLAGDKIGKEGNLQEWMIDRMAKTSHRHTSHLFAVYPGNQISMKKTPELAEAARKSLEWRGTSGDSRRSWAWPWRMALWARFLEGEKAYEMFKGLLTHNTLPNLLTTHPPMQMDGNFGLPAGVTEMLLQSHAGEIHLLPAPTKAWPDGSVKGLRARGNITVSFSWKNGRVVDYRLTSPNPGPVTLRMNGKTTTVTPKKAGPVNVPAESPSKVPA